MNQMFSLDELKRQIFYVAAVFLAVALFVRRDF